MITRNRIYQQEPLPVHHSSLLRPFFFLTNILSGASIISQGLYMGCGPASALYGAES